MSIVRIAAPEKINLLIIGTGMYVCGRGTDGSGTVLPAVIQCRQSGIIGKVLVASKEGGSFTTFEAKLRHLQEYLGIDLPYSRYPSGNDTNPAAFRDAIKDLPDPGAVIIAAPDHLHTQMALTAIQSGKHVLVVKPLAPSVAEGYQMIRAMEQSGVYCAVEFHKRWDWANLKLRDLLQRGVLGDPLYFHVEYSQRKLMPTQAFSAWVDHTTIFQYLGIHYADIIYFVTGDRPCRLVATGQQNWLFRQGITTYDAIQVLIEWSKGFVSTILTNWIDPNNNSAMSQQMIKVIGTKGRLESNQTNRGLQVVTDRDNVEEVNPYFCQSYHDLDVGCTRYKGYGIQSITQFIKDVAEIVKGHRTSQYFEGRRPTFRDALVSTAIVEAARLSLENDSKWVYFNDTLEPYLR